MRPNVRLFFGAILALAVQGCDNGTNPEPPDTSRPDGGPRDAWVADAPSDAGHDAFVAPDANIDAYVTPDVGFDGGPDDANVDAFVAPDAFDCNDPTGCYRCPPTTDPQFLNHCRASGVTCEPFPVTTARLPHLHADGTLPALP